MTERKGFDFTAYSLDDRTKACLDFSDYVKSKLLKTRLADLPPIEERNAIVTEYTESYYNHFGETMHTVCLYYLSNYLLLDFIKDPRVFKSKDEGSFLSPRQLATRAEKELPVSNEFMSALRADYLFNISRPVLKVNMDDV